MAARTAVPVSPDIARLVAGLEPAQREAVLADDPVVCVLAGAGTGKTRVLTLRVARRVMDESALATHLLVCTFSRKAADELRDRLWTLGIGRELQAGTLHRAALRLIAHHRQDHGQAAPTIVADRRPLLAELLDGTPVRGRRRSARPSAQRIDVSRLDAEIGWAKSRLVDPPTYEEAARRASRRPSMPAGKVAEHYARYESERRARGVLDLDDLLWHCGDLLTQDPAFARAIRWWHRHLFVDEMQDLNEAQYRLLRLLVGDEPDLFVVGDPNQAVYGWNGADPELLRRVTEEFAGTRVVRLETNHRCTAPVVQMASAALGHDDPPVSARGAGPLPEVRCLGNDEEEARWVARRVWLAHRPGRRWSSIAVLARTNAQLQRIACALRAEHVPYRMAGSDLGPASDLRETPEDADAETAAETAAETDAETAAAPAGAAGLPGGDPAQWIGGDADSVVLSTFHRAKGLQWRTVFVVGASDGLVPFVTARTGAAKAEERRLFYVALTRAEEELFCSWGLRPDAASAFDGVPERRRSPWLDAVQRVLDELHDAESEAAPSRAVEHIATMRRVISSPSVGADAPSP